MRSCPWEITEKAWELLHYNDNITIVLHNSMVSFMCFHLFLSTPNQLMLLNSTEYGRAHWKPITLCSCWGTMCWFAPKLFVSRVVAPFIFSLVKSSSSPFRTAVRRRTLCSRVLSALDSLSVTGALRVIFLELLFPFSELVRNIKAVLSWDIQALKSNKGSAQITRIHMAYKAWSSH